MKNVELFCQPSKIIQYSVCEINKALYMDNLILLISDVACFSCNYFQSGKNNFIKFLALFGPQRIICRRTGAQTKTLF